MWHHGWPLSIQGFIILHLGTINEALLLNRDIYICLRPFDDTVQLCAVWRSASYKIIYRPLDPDKDLFTPLTLDMLGEDLPTLLQTLLVGIEHQICRVPLNDVSSFNQDKISPSFKGNDESNSEYTQTKSPKNCGLKRRDLITKNKVINTKYSLKRMNSALVNGTDEIAHKNENKDAVDSPLDPSSMPLFCLGGSFPHIDSDEDSCEDSTIRKFDEGKKYLFSPLMHRIDIDYIIKLSGMHHLIV